MAAPKGDFAAIADVQVSSHGVSATVIQVELSLGHGSGPTVGVRNRSGQIESARSLLGQTSGTTDSSVNTAGARRDIESQGIGPEINRAIDGHGGGLEGNRSAQNNVSLIGLARSGGHIRVQMDRLRRHRHRTGEARRKTAEGDHVAPRSRSGHRIGRVHHQGRHQRRVDPHRVRIRPQNLTVDEPRGRKHHIRIHDHILVGAAVVTDRDGIPHRFRPDVRDRQHSPGEIHIRFRTERARCEQDHVVARAARVADDVFVAVVIRHD